MGLNLGIAQKERSQWIRKQRCLKLSQQSMVSKVSVPSLFHSLAFMKSPFYFSTFADTFQHSSTFPCRRFQATLGVVSVKRTRRRRFIATLWFWLIVFAVTGATDKSICHSQPQKIRICAKRERVTTNTLQDFNPFVELTHRRGS